MENYTLPTGKVLVLRSCKPDMSSHSDFVWPTSGPVSCPDWRDNTECGNGLHGWLWAQGNFGLKYKEPGAKWLALEVEENDIRQLDGKVKFPSCTVLVTGTFREAYDFVMKHFWLKHAAELAVQVVQDPNAKYSDQDEVSVVTTLARASASAAGYNGHASAAGYNGHASAAGYNGHASAAGKYGHASAAGENGHASAAGKYGHASAAGENGHASAAGENGHASAAGENGHAVVIGLGGKARCGENGAVILTYWDGSRRRHVIGYAGENGIEAGKWYKLNDKNELVETTI